MNSGLGTKDFRNSFIEFLGNGPSRIKKKINKLGRLWINVQANKHTHKQKNILLVENGKIDMGYIFALKEVLALHKVGSQWLLRP